MPSAHPPAAESPQVEQRALGIDEGEELDDETVQLARRLMHRASGAAPRMLGDADEAVVLDLKADGIRCLLIAHADEAGAQHSLSPREQEIVRMISCGYPNKTVAVVLDISTWTVATHLRRIFAKLGVRNRAAMVARAIELRLVPPPGRAPPPAFDREYAESAGRIGRP